MEVLPAAPERSSLVEHHEVLIRISELERKVEEILAANDALQQRQKAAEGLVLALDRFRMFDVCRKARILALAVLFTASRAPATQVNRAMCHLESDRQRLLAVVDSAYGSLNEFNRHVRSIFSEQNAHLFQWSSKSSVTGQSFSKRSSGNHRSLSTSLGRLPSHNEGDAE